MKSPDPLLDAWRETLRRSEYKPAILDASGQAARTFLEVDRRAREYEAKLESFTSGSVISVQIGNHEDWPSIFIACLRSNLIVLPLETSINKQQRHGALELCQVQAVVSALPSEGAPQISRRMTADATAQWDERPPVLLKLTSGTTAAPRAIRFRSQQLLADCNQICDTMGITDADLNFGVIPISHSYGFSNLLTPLIVRGVPMVLSRDRTPRAIVRDLARSEATVLPGTPVFYQAFCEMENIPAAPMLRLCISAGAPLLPAVAKRFREKFQLAIHSFYGASECGGICYDREGENAEDGFVGQAMKGIRVELLDPTERASQIRVVSAAAADGYFPESGTPKLGNGIFVPDDLLARQDSGFKIVGRISDVINVAGKKVNPAEVEQVLLRFAGIRQAVVFGRESKLRNEEVVACIVIDTDVGEKELLMFCSKQLSDWQVPKRIFIVDSIPINERGKISRRDLARRFSIQSANSRLPTLGS